MATSTCSRLTGKVAGGNTVTAALFILHNSLLPAILPAFSFADCPNQSGRHPAVTSLGLESRYAGAVVRIVEEGADLCMAQNATPSPRRIKIFLLQRLEQRQANAFHELCKTRVGAQTIETGLK